MKYGFILNSDGCTPDNFRGRFSSDDFEAYVIGTENQEMACAAAKHLLEDIGVDVIDLCADFIPERRDEIRDAVDHRGDICSAKFLKSQADKIEGVDWDQFGFIVKGKGLNHKDHVVRLDASGFHLTMVGVSSLEEVYEAISDLIVNGITVVELSRFFGEEETGRIIEFVETNDLYCAVGSAGMRQ